MLTPTVHLHPLLVRSLGHSCQAFHCAISDGDVEFSFDLLAFSSLLVILNTFPYLSWSFGCLHFVKSLDHFSVIFVIFSLSSL